MSAAAMLVALLVDAGLGWPARLYARIGHPVTWIGRLVAGLEARLNREGDSDALRRAAGAVAALATIAVVAGLAALVASALPGGLAGVLVTGLLAWPLVASRSMHEHVAAVARPLAAGDIDAARGAVAMIVGRDPAALDEAGVARAAIESLAENTSDGIVAPLFWGVLLGLPGIAAYKAINTLDSMIGHRNARYAAFGWAAARIDDVANLAPARLTGALFALASATPGLALATMTRDARRHRSPNAGWPEAAMAGALGVRLSGPRVYGDHVADEPWLNGEARDPGPADVAAALRLYRRAMAGLGVLVAAIAVALHLAAT